MIRNLLMLFLVAGLATASGCVMCAAPDDAAYSAYGGAWQRDDMVHGRVGSVLDPTGGPYLATSYVESPREEGDWGDEPQWDPSADDETLQPPPGAGEPPEELLPPAQEDQPPRPLPTEGSSADSSPTRGSYP